jgi:hypothetical protein
LIFFLKRKKERKKERIQFVIHHIIYIPILEEFINLPRSDEKEKHRTAE